MKRVKIILLGLILVFTSATCFVACDPEDEPVRNHPGSTDTNTTVTDTTDSGEDTIVVVEPVVTSDICLECGENIIENTGFWVNNTNSQTLGEPINDTLDIVCRLYRYENYYLLNIIDFCGVAGKMNSAIMGMICNQNNLKQELDYIWNNYPSNGTADAFSVLFRGWEYKLVRVKGIFSFVVTNISDYTGPEGFYELDHMSKSHSLDIAYFGIKVLNIEHTEEPFYLKQGNTDLEWYYDQALDIYFNTPHDIHRK